MNRASRLLQRAEELRDRLPGTNRDAEDLPRHTPEGTPLRGRVVFVLKRLAREWKHDDVPDRAAGVAFYAILSLFPALLALAALLGVVQAVVGGDLASRAETEVIVFLDSVLTSEADGTIEAVQSLFSQSRPGVLTFSLLAALWTLSRAFAGLVRALDAVYDLDEHRSWVSIRATTFGLGVGSVLAAAVMLAMLVVGPLFGTGEDIAAEIGLGDQFATLWNVARPPFAFAVLVLWAATIFHVAPDHRTPWRWDLPGAIVTGFLWIAFSGGLRAYLEIAQTGNAVFGTVGGVLVVLLWFWVLTLAVLIGGEVNEIVYHEVVRHDHDGHVHDDGTPSGRPLDPRIDPELVGSGPAS